MSNKSIENEVIRKIEGMSKFIKNKFNSKTTIPSISFLNWDSYINKYDIGLIRRSKNLDTVNCQNSCSGGCWETCQGLCRDGCLGTCQGNCTGDCYGTCKGCRGGCEGNCSNNSL